MRILVTGGCGFIGSNFIRHILDKYNDYEVVNLDALTYAGNVNNLKDVDTKRYRFVHDSVASADTVVGLIRDVDAVVNFAAESHVDRSIEDAQPFLITNVMGVQVLLDAARKADIKRFVHISTDEVYGSLETDEGVFTETTPLGPNSPYSASKGAADLLVHAYFRTYGFPVCTVRPSNNYGPYQFPEKFIPLMITNLIDGQPVPLYGEGRNVRDWFYVGDNCRAIDMVLHKGTGGQVYNAGGLWQRKNIEIVHQVLDIMGKDHSAIRYVKDRPGHDYRYALSNDKIHAELGFTPQMQFRDGLEHTVRWFKDNQWWWRPLKERLVSESKGFWG
ncbi:dTDP-glucose 4,6-dehydratase [Candidatus Magnetobacterium bavaricum]|uniref:dTDP-glucose 4,6-dehydratase n=1 Tax=Candidatus Magnetobacterium bavaricum TaxID=29290 RepID=D7GXD5_9BACT|nr:dTDP-glucose 4,6-dehydratase [Candidatus Magnetobacterium bavaricum]CBL42925.1 dTDP-glucose 4,6-dehydratase [Candidatus Magnetobacterium bavaricum]